MILVSACLVRVNCRYNGRDFPDERIYKLFREGKAIAVCPEMLGGLPSPRKPCEIREGRVYASDGIDLTEEFRRGAEIGADIARAAGCRCAVLKAKSPSCGCGRIYDGTFTGKIIEGDGFFAALLRENGVTVFTEETVPDALL
ncbi:MAG: DUF523 domain-containing protein [Spirochaetota bacterium]